MKHLALFIILALFTLFNQGYAQVPDWKWAITAGGADAATDNAGNVYLTGYVKDSLVIGNTVLKNSAGDHDIYIAKIDPSGNVLWAKTTPGNNNELANGIDLDNAGNIYLNASVKISSLPFVFNGLTLNTFGSDDFLFVKYDNNGNLQWAKTAGGPDLDFTFSDGISCDPNGGFVITGKFGSYCVLDNDTLNSNGNEDIIIAKYNSNGDVLWFKGAGGKKSDRGFSVTTDASGNVFATGYYTDTAWFDNTVVTAGDVLGHTYLAKYNAPGQLQWVKSTGGQLGANIVVDGSGNIYVTGLAGSSNMFNGILAGGTGYTFLVKYDNTGNALWAGKHGRTGSGLPDVEVDPLGNVYLSADSIITQKFNSTGQSLWEVINPKREYSAILTSDRNGNIYASGTLYGGSIIIGTHSVAAPHYLARLSPFPNDIDELSRNTDIMLYPNPATGTLNVKGMKFSTWSISNTAGHQVLSGNGSDIDAASLPAGNYLLHLQSAGKTATLKLTKE